MVGRGLLDRLPLAAAIFALFATVFAQLAFRGRLAARSSREPVAAFAMQASSR